MHDGLMYLVMGGVTPGHSEFKDEIEAIRTSWTWTPIEPPDQHLEFHAQPLSLGEGAATLNVPGIDAYLSNRASRPRSRSRIAQCPPELAGFLDLCPDRALPQGLSFAEYKNRLSERLRTQGMGKGPIKWQTQGYTRLAS